MKKLKKTVTASFTCIALTVCPLPLFAETNVTESSGTILVPGPTTTTLDAKQREESALARYQEKLNEEWAVGGYILLGGGILFLMSLGAMLATAFKHKLIPCIGTTSEV